MEKMQRFMKQHRMFKRVISFVLAFAMILTMGAFSDLGTLVTKAEEVETVTLHFELPDGTSVTDWCVNAWSTTAIGDSEHAFRPSTWGSGDTYPTLLVDSANSGWGYCQVPTSLTGIQFVKADGTEINNWNSVIISEGYADAYYSTTNSKWYTSAACTTEIKAKSQKVYFELPEGTTVSDWCVNAWGTGVAVTGSDTKFRPASWGDGATFPTLLSDAEKSGWGYVTITGEISGLQFVDATGSKEYNCWSTDNALVGINEFYYSPASSKWYTGSDKSVEINPIKLYFELPEDSTVTDWAVNIWKNSGTQPTVAGDSDNAFRPSTWGTGASFPTLMADDSLSGWGYVVVNGSVDGMQFVNKTGTEYNCWNSAITDTGIKAAYYSPASGKWYTSSSKTTEVVANMQVSTTATVTLHFQKPSDWAKVVVKLAQGTEWTSIENYEYCNTWPGAEVKADEKNAGWYSLKITMPASTQLDCIFNNNNNGQQTANICFTPDENTEEWVTYTTNQGVPTISTTAPTGWVTSTSEAPINPAASLGYTSPEVNGTEVTFRYKPTTALAEGDELSVLGDFNDWNLNDESCVMTDSDSDGIYEVTLTISQGKYAYKFTLNHSWSCGGYTDSANTKYSGTNSLLVVSGLQNASVSAEKGVAVTLPTLNYYDTDGNASEATIASYTVEAAAKDYVTIADGKLTVAAGFTGTSFKVTAKDSDNHTSTITVNVVDKMYNYTIYYYDWNAEHMATDASAMWIWENNGGSGKEYAFASVETLSDDNSWLKATISVPYTDFSIIPKVKSEDATSPVWTWQGKTYAYVNTDKTDNVTLYLVSNQKKAATTLPELVAPRTRNVVVEYKRTNADYDGWNIYTWNSGFGSDVSCTGTVSDGVDYITIPVEDYSTDLRLAFCMRRSPDEDNAWAEKDGGDHYLNVPADQTCVKAVFDQDQGITTVLPYNVGYEMDGANDTIHFYYRDDALFLTNEEDTLAGKVEVVVNGQTYAMTYDETNERYTYDLKGLTTGDYSYYYLVDGVKVLDSFNSKKTADKSASLLTYKHYDNLSVSATAKYATMTYNDNNVISVAFAGADAANMSQDEVASITLDGSALGIGDFSIEPELMAGTISCLYTIAAGEKTLPVEVKDIYGNVYKTNVKVTVTERVKAQGDFDWDESIIYFTVTDRFFDGNTSNDTGVDKDGSLSYHGGDFAGLTQKLDYLEDLGVNTIWITPIVENSDTTTTKDGETIESTGYHGYWASNFTELNSYLGTEEEFAALISEVHARDMKLMVDVVVNHAGYDTESYFNTIVNDETGETMQMIRSTDETVEGSDVYASLSGLPDFLTEDEDVREQLIEWQTGWMSKYDIDYYRVDTVKHVDTTTWKAFKNALTNANQDFKMIGEEAGSGYASQSANLGTGSMDSLLDFDFNDNAKSFLSGSISDVESFMTSRNSALTNYASLGSFMNSHDEDGLQIKLQEDCGMTEEESAALMKAAASFMITAKGMPVIYYGEEIGQYGEDNYPYQTNRYDMDWDEVASELADSTSLLNHYKTMLAIRNAYTDVFARGTRTTIDANDEEGYDIFSRSYGDDTLYVGINIKDQAKAISVSIPESAGKIYKDLYTGTLYIATADNTVEITLPACTEGGTFVLTEDKSLDYQFTISDGDFSEVVRTIGAITAGKVTVTLMNTTTVSADVFTALKGKDVTLVVNMENGVTWSINGKTIEKLIGKVDLGIKLGTKNIAADLIKALAGNRDTYQFSINHNGAFGFTGTLSFKVDTKFSGKYANLYMLNETKNSLEFQCACKVASDGQVSFPRNHGSEYVIVFDDKDLTPVATVTADTTATTTTTVVANDAPTVTAAPKTGDRSPLAPIACALLGGLAIAVAFKRRKNA